MQHKAKMAAESSLFTSHSSSATSINLPVLDFSQPLTHSVLESLLLACQEWGFFQIVNHGITKDFYKKLHSLSNQIFSLPSHVKQLRAGPSSDVRTYTPFFIASPFYESLRVSGPDFFGSGMSSSQALLNNNNNSEFSDAVEEYGRKMTNLSKKVLELVVMSLGGSNSKRLLREFTNCQGYMRINNYSRTEITSEGGQGEVEGLGMHTDMSCITIVYQDDTGGLQVRSKEGKWMDINSCNGNLVVNIGDLMQAWSNGRLRSSEHRVVLRKRVCRFSIAFFWCFEDEKEVFAPKEVVGEGNLRAYKPFVCEDYVKFRENNEQGKFEKVGFTVQHFAGI